MARENSLLRYFGVENGRKVVPKHALLWCFAVESGQYLVRNSVFSHSVKLMHAESSRDPQTYCEKLTRDRSFVLHARLVFFNSKLGFGFCMWLFYIDPSSV